jgi:hypothetical protein
VTFKVRLTRDAEADLDRLFDFLVERELARDGGDLYLPEQAMVALRAGIATLKSSPFTCRKAGNSPFLRESIISVRTHETLGLATRAAPQRQVTPDRSTSSETPARPFATA